MSTPRERKPGRPCKLTPEVHGKILANVRLGAFAWVAAQAAGISPRTFHRWMAAGASGDPEFRQLCDDVTQAAAEARQEAEWAVRKFRPLEWLKLGPGRDRGPQEPGWTDRTEVTGADGAPVTHIVRIVRE